MTIEDGPTRGNGQQSVSALEARLEYESQEQLAFEADRRHQEDEGHRARVEADLDTSWVAADLGPFVDGTAQIEPPVFFPRSDGPCLLYAGKTHYFIGESESGKTWAALVAIKDILERGLGAMFIDYEDEAATFVNRLRQLGVSGDVIRDRSRLAYMHPDEAFQGQAAIRH